MDQRASTAPRRSEAAVPHFLILGAAKCGTTSLHAWLSKHPQILMSSPKEPLHFELEYERGMDYYLATYFAEWDGRKLIGESRHRNLLLPWVPERIQETSPDAKLIILVRNPVERCLSHWWMRFHRCKESLNFEEAVLADLERLESGLRHETEEEYAAYQRRRHPDGIYRTYVDSGYYIEQLERYRQLFSDAQILVLTIEDLQFRPRAVLSELCSFLGISTSAIANIDCELRNAAGLLKRQRAVRRWITCRLSGRSVSYSAIRRRPPIRPEFRRFLADHYHRFNADLAKVLNRDLSHWI